jgi:hypothetical protein
MYRGQVTASTSSPVGLTLDVIRPERVYSNAECLCAFAGTGAPTPENPLEFRNAFLGALNRVQPHPFWFDPTTTEIPLDFGDGDRTPEETFRALMTVDEMPSTWRYSDQERTDVSGKMKQAIECLREVDEPLSSALHAVVATFLFARRDHFGGGSVSHLIGPIWFGPSSSWTEIDYAENVVHEFVHQCLFLDEMVNTVFSATVPRMAQQDALVTSTILRRRRGYDKAYHSAFVAAAVMQLDLELGQRTRARHHLEAVEQTIAELYERDRFLTDHGRMLLDQLSGSAQQLRADLEMVPRC